MNFQAYIQLLYCFPVPDKPFRGPEAQFFVCPIFPIKTIDP